MLRGSWLFLRGSQHSRLPAVTANPKSFPISSTDPHTRNILLVECLGKAHRLSAIHVKEMELVFDSDPKVEHTSDGKLRRTEKLRLTRTSSQK
jgi:hypothetical protein